MKKFVLPALVILLLSLTIIVPYAMEQSTTQPEHGKALSEPEQVLSDPEQISVPDRVQIIVYVYDPCGGCGVGQGCGECTELGRYNAMVMNQLGSLFSDGYVVYRMHNSRILHFEENRIARSKRYGIPEELRLIWPTVFIGTEDSGLYLLGEELMPYIREILDRFMDGEDVEGLQREIAERGGW